MKSIIKSILLLFLLALGSCERFVTLEAPKSEMATETVFKDSVNARGALLGLHVSIIQGMGILSGSLSIYPGLSADELIVASNSKNEYEFYQNNILESNGLVEAALWTRAYQVIYSANAIMEGIDQSDGIPPTAKATMIAEARLIRGIYYFYLVNLFGGVPLVSTTNYNINRILERSTVAQVYAFIEEDLNAAKLHLSSDYSRIDLNTLTAESMLAKVYLYQEKYQQALDASAKVIGTGFYSLEQDLKAAFLADNSEAIWNVDLVNSSFGAWDAYYFVPTRSTAIPKFILSPSLYEAFEPGDLRKEAWVATNTVAGVDYHYPFKYKHREFIANERYSVFRLAELYLIRAEAFAKLNKLPEALEDVNRIRVRAGLEQISLASQEDVLLAIEKERQVELFCEWGNRWFDLIRTHRATEVLSGLKPEWTSTAMRYPIPLYDITANPKLTQNEGY